jgi:hypothetical protein
VFHLNQIVIPAKAGISRDGARCGGGALAREVPAFAGMTGLLLIINWIVIPAKAGISRDGARCGGSALAREVPAFAGMTIDFLCLISSAGAAGGAAPFGASWLLGLVI